MMLRYLIMQKSKKTEVNYPSTFTLCQYQILCRIIIQKKIKKEFFIICSLNYMDQLTGKK